MEYAYDDNTDQYDLSILNQFVQVNFETLVDPNEKYPEFYLLDQLRKAFRGFEDYHFEYLTQFSTLNSSIKGLHSQKVKRKYFKI